MNRTNIPWVLNPLDGTLGYTWNPITGCLNGCDYCYARKLANGRLKKRYLANKDVTDEVWVINPYEKPFVPRFWPEKLRDRGLFQEKPRGIFVCSMSDLFGIGVPEEWTDRIMDQMKVHRQHRFYLLTKQPQNLPTSPSYFPDNCWVGVTVTTKEMHLRLFSSGFKKVKAKVKYLSLEPLLENIYFHPADIKSLGINWLIIGALTGAYKDLIMIAANYPSLTLMPAGKKWSLQPPFEWVTEIVKAATKARVKVFLKDSLWPLYKKAYDLVNEPGLRQEMPV